MTLILPNYQNMSIESHVKLPPPLKETHSILGKISYENNFKSIDYLAKYRTILSEKKYGSWGNVNYIIINVYTPLIVVNFTRFH